MNQQLMGMAPFLLIFVAMYFLIIRPQQKKAKQHEDMISALGKGDRIVTTGGLMGTIQGLQEKEISLEIAKDTVVQVSRPMIAAKIEAPSKKAAEPKKAPAAKKKTVSKK